LISKFGNRFTEGLVALTPHLDVNTQKIPLSRWERGEGLGMRQLGFTGCPHPWPFSQREKGKTPWYSTQPYDLTPNPSPNG
jgi:hypothetical protein